MYSFTIGGVYIFSVKFIDFVNYENIHSYLVKKKNFSQTDFEFIFSGSKLMSRKVI